jgi:tryptophan synthase alpha chain
MSAPNRIDSTFERLRSAGQSGFIAYITGGDPDLDTTLEIALALEKSGCDILELGVPFSDPLADGATIQAAAGRALAAGTTIDGLFECLRRLRAVSEMPVVIFTYLNPVYAYGFERFHETAAAAGADGILILDLPPDEAPLNSELSVGHGLKMIQLIAPTTPPARMQTIADSASGFIYYVSREGVTGEQSTLSDSITAQVAEIRRHTNLPIAVGFGISTPDQAAEVAKSADAVVVGSAIVRKIAEVGSTGSHAKAVIDFVTPLVTATKSKPHGS